MQEVDVEVEGANALWETHTKHTHTKHKTEPTTSEWNTKKRNTNFELVHA
jgi:hypothetical protein